MRPRRDPSCDRPSGRWPAISRPVPTVKRRLPRRSPNSAAMFSGEAIVDPAVLRSLFESTGGFQFEAAALAGGVAVLLAEAGVFPSRGDARRTIAGGGLTVNGTRVTDAAFVPELVGGEWLDVRVGKRRREVGRLIR